MFKKGGVDLATFVGGIVRALTKGQEALPKARREQIGKHFDKNESTGLYHPKMMSFAIGEGQQISVPTYSIARVNNIGIDTALVKCSAKIVEVAHEEMNCELADHSHQVKFFVKPSSPDKKSFEIEIKFSKNMNREGQNRLYDALDGLVEIQPVEEITK